MAFTGEDLSNFNLALKTFYVDETIDDVPNGVKFLKTIRGRMNERPAAGQSITATWAAQTAENLGWGALTEDGDFATPRKGTYKNYSLSVAHLNCGFEFSGHLEAAGTRKDANFFMQLGEKFANDTKKSITLLMGILVTLDGTAVLGTVLSVSSNTITMDTGQIHNITLGMRLTIRSAATAGSELLSGSQPSSGTVTSVDEPNNKFTITSAATGSSLVGGYIAIYELYDTTLPNAIRNIVGTTGTFQGLNRATAGNELAKGSVRADTGAIGDNMLIQAAHDVLKMTRNESNPDWLAITDFDTTRWYYMTKADQVRWTADQKKIIGGYDSIAISTGGGGTVNLAADQRAWPGEVTILNPTDMGLLRPTSGLKSGWVENGSGGYLFQKTGSAANGVYADAKQGWWVERYNIYNDRPRNTFRLTSYRSV